MIIGLFIYRTTMPLSKENTIFIYRLNDADSYEIALAYQELHSLSNNQLVGIECSDKEVLDSYSQFLSEVEVPIQVAIENKSNVFCIVLGYKVPGGFKDGEDVISSTSRIARINHPFQKKTKSDLFDRRVYKRFDEVDAAKSLIVSRIDGYSKDSVLNQIFQTQKIINQKFCAGTFYFDPYSDKVGKEAEIYVQDLHDFQDNILPDLALKTKIATFIDAYVDSFHPYLENDCFYWGWFTDRGSDDFFKKTSSSRVFFYNADFDGAESVRQATTDKWVQLALSSGYALSAGALSNSSIDGFLRPTPFFESLQNNSTIGEAYLFSNPYYDWTMTLFGDPLVSPSFPSAFVGVTRSDEVDYDWYDLLTEVEKVLAYQSLINTQTKSIANAIVAPTDVTTTAELLPSISSGTSFILDKSKTWVGTILASLEAYVLSKRLSRGKSFDSYLSSNSFRISKQVKNRFGSSVSSPQILPQGYWQIDFDIKDETGIYSEYNFELEVSDKEDFSNIIQTIDSASDKTGWYYEVRKNEYLPFIQDAIASNYVGMNIRYQSNSSQFLTRGVLYYFRLRQKTDTTVFEYRTKEEVVYT